MTWNEIQTEIQTHTILFFKKDRDNRLAVGSGVCIELDDDFFLISAAHVFDEGLDSLWIITTNTETNVGGELIFTDIPEGKKRLEDKLDFGILKLNAKSVSELKKRHKFLNQEKIQINHQNNFNKIGYRYYVFGYPSTQTKKHWITKDIRSVPFKFSTDTKSNQFYVENDWDYRSHLILGFDRKKVIESLTKHQKIAPQLEGISGCGVWRFVKEESEWFYYLVGIIIETDQNPHQKILIAPKIDLITETIKKVFQKEFPDSKLCKVKIKNMVSR